MADDPAPSPVATLIGPAVTAIGSPTTLPLGFSTGTITQVAYSGLAAFDFARGPAMVHDPPPSVEELQAVLAEVVLPALLEAEEHLFEITNSSFTFTVTEKMQGELPIDADPLELDYTEILTMQAGVQAALAAIDVSAAYQLTPNPLDDHPQSWVDALEPGSPFLKLATGGEAALGDALERLQSAGTLLLSAIDELEAETDDQTDDIIKIGPDDLTAQELADARDVIQDVLDALSGPTPITLEEGTIDEFSIMVNAREFFIDPIEDFKAMLPPYEVFTADEDGEEVVVARWTELNLDEWTFPDPTFSGILPEMLTTAVLLAQDLDIGEFFFEFSLTAGSYRLISRDGLDCKADDAAGGTGCVTGGGHLLDTWIDLGHNDGEPEAWLKIEYETISFEYLGTYDVVDNLDGTHTVTMDLWRQFGDFSQFTFPVLFTDIPGFTHTDEFFRDRGGSSMVFFSSEWTLEKQH